MTNKFVFDKGRVVETFNYIFPDDQYNEYIGNLVDYNGTIYEIITYLNGVVVDAEGNPNIIANNGISEIYDHIDYLNSKPLNISNDLNIDTSFKGDLVIEDGRLFYNGVEIIPMPEDDFTANEINTFKDDDITSDNMPTINYVDNRFF